MTYLTSGGRFCNQGKKCLQATVTIVHWTFDYHWLWTIIINNYNQKWIMKRQKNVLLSELSYNKVGPPCTYQYRRQKGSASPLCWQGPVMISMIIISSISFIIIIINAIDDDIICIIRNIIIIFRLTTTRPCQWKHRQTGGDRRRREIEVGSMLNPAI